MIIFNAVASIVFPLAVIGLVYAVQTGRPAKGGLPVDPFEGTVSNTAALYQFQVAGSLHPDGIIMGRDTTSGAPFVFDPWALYKAGLLTNANAVVAGQIGRGKSSLIKALIWRQAAIGRRSVVIDPKGEFGPLARAMGGSVVRLAPGGDVKINPIGGQDPTRAKDALLRLVSVLIPQPVDHSESVALAVAYDDARRSTHPHMPRLVDVQRALSNPSQDAATAAGVDVDTLKGNGAEVAAAVWTLVNGSLAGMVDGDSSDVDWDAPLIVVDVSALTTDDAALSVAMTAAMEWLHPMIADENADNQRFVILDEAWRVLANPRQARWLQAMFKLSRQYGISNVIVIHRLSDLDAVGDEGSADRAVVHGLLADAETRIVFGQPVSETPALRSHLRLSNTEADVLTGLPKGVYLARVGPYSACVRLEPHPDRAGDHEHRRGTDRTGGGDLMKTVFGVIAVALIALVTAPMFLVQAVWSAAHLSALSSEPSDVALDDIPPLVLNAYLDAGLVCETIPWNVVAAVGKAEHDHGRGGPFEFPPVPDWRDDLPDGFDHDAPVARYRDDGIDTPPEIAAASSSLAEFLCAAADGSGDRAPGADITPVTGAEFGDGNIYPVTGVGEWNAAVAAAGPGDVIRIDATINAVLRYTGASGSATQPITITAAPGAWIDPGNHENNTAALLVMGVEHVQVAGVNVRNSGFGIWMAGVTGTPEAPVLVHGNEINGTGHAALVVSGHGPGFTPGTDPSNYVQISSNTIRRTGLEFPQFGEGIYIGHGGTEWIDTTSNVTVVENDISETTAEGVDIKPGTSGIRVEANLIHDLSPIYGGAISAHYTNLRPNPDVGDLDDVLIRGNAIWNVTRGGAGSSDHAIWVGHGGVTVTGNTIWGAQTGIRVRGEQPFGHHPVTLTDNILWVPTPIEVVDAAELVTMTGNRGPAGRSGIQTGAEFDGAPEPGALGDADNGGGPGSVFGFVPIVRQDGYAAAEAASALRTALEVYNPDTEWVDTVWEIAASYADLPAPGGPGRYADGPVPLDERGCPEAPVDADQIVTVEGFRVHPCIADDLEALLAHAEADGIDFGGWAWRDPEAQLRLRRQNCGPTRGYDPGDYEVPSSTCRPPTARPGRSMHERGLAIDFTYRGRGIPTRDNSGYRWLAANAAAYGFYNLPSEPWHWSVNGR